MEVRKISEKRSPGFMIYDETAILFDSLPTEKAGELIQALSRYKLREETPSDCDPIVIAVFASLKVKLDEAEAKYKNRCEVNAQNSRQRSSSKGADSKRVEANDTDSKPTKTKTKTQTKTQTKTDKSLFEEFWSSYPRKVKKIDAKKAWDKLNPNDELIDDILKALEAWKKSDQWTRDEGKFIPYPATWLRGEQWNDEIPRARKTIDRHPPSFSSDDFRARAQEPLEYHRKEST